MKAYIASPFFDDVQLREVQEVESEMDRMGVDAFSPRLSVASKMYSDALRSKMDPDSAEMKRIKKYIFIDDVDKINDVDMFLVNLNNFDSGTLWELGYHLTHNFNAEAKIIPFGTNHEKLGEIISKYYELYSEFSKVDDESYNKTKYTSIIMDLRKGFDVYSVELDKPCSKYLGPDSIWIIAESAGAGPYLGISKVMLGSLFPSLHNGKSIVHYIDVPRKSNIMLTQSGAHVFEYTGNDYGNEVFDFTQGIPTNIKPIKNGYDE